MSYSKRYLTPKEVDFILNSCGYSGQLKHMNMFESHALHPLFLYYADVDVYLRQLLHPHTLTRRYDWHNFGKYYKNTLIAWYNNINKKWSEIPQFPHNFEHATQDDVLE